MEGFFQHPDKKLPALAGNKPLARLGRKLPVQDLAEGTNTNEEQS